MAEAKRGMKKLGSGREKRYREREREREQVKGREWVSAFAWRLWWSALHYKLKDTRIFARCYSNSLVSLSPEPFFTKKRLTMIIVMPEPLDRQSRGRSYCHSSPANRETNCTKIHREREREWMKDWARNTGRGERERDKRRDGWGEWWVEEKFFYFWAIFNSKSRVYQASDTEEFSPSDSP